MRKKYLKPKQEICDKAIIFARVSSKRQKEEGVSLDVQMEAITKYCEEKNLKIIKDYCIDESSMKGDRRQYHEMLDLAQKTSGPVAIVVNYVDRLQRNYDDSYLLNKLRREGKIEVHFLKENLIIHKNSNSMELNFWNMHVLMANAQVNNMIDKVKGSQRLNRSQGKWQGSAPLGYLNRRDEDNKATLILDPVRAPIIQHLFQEFATGKHTTKTIWLLSQQLGLYSKMKIRKGQLVSRNTVYDVLTNPFYEGFMHYEGKWIRHQYEPLVSKELFDKVQNILTRNGNHNRNNVDENAGKLYIFRGLIHCKECGCLITPETKTKKNGQVYVYLRCGHSKKDYNHCHQGIVNENIILNQLKEEVFNKITLPPTIQELLKKKLLKDLNQTANFNASVKSNTTNLLTALKLKEDRLLDFYLEGKLNQATYDSKKAEIESERKRLLDNIEKYKEIDSKMRDKIINIVSIASDLKHVFDIATTSQKSALLKLLLKDCKLNGKILEYELNKPFDKLLSCPNYQEWTAITINNLDAFEKLGI